MSADDLEVSVDPPAYPDLDGVTLEEKRRAFIARHYLTNSAEIDGRILVSNLSTIEAWLREGAVPEEKKGRGKLKTVEA